MFDPVPTSSVGKTEYKFLDDSNHSLRVRHPSRTWELGRRGFALRTGLWAVAGALLFALVGGGTPITVLGSGPQAEVRIAAQRLDDGRTEFALQHRGSDGEWGDRILPTSRFFPAGPAVGRWIVSSVLTVSAPGAGEGTAGIEVRIAAQRLGDGRTEFALQHRGSDGEWGDRILPASRFFPADPAIGRWLNSSPLTVRTPGDGEETAGTDGENETEGAEVRIAAQRLGNGRTEFALQQRGEDGEWGDRILPASRFFPADPDIGRWLASSPLVVRAPGAGEGTAGIEVRLAARRLDDGRTEFALQLRVMYGAWGERMLPGSRFSPAEPAVGLWLTSSPLTVKVPRPAGGPMECPEQAAPDWWIPTDLGYHSEASSVAYYPRSLEHLVFDSDIVVHAALASVAARTEQVPLPDYVIRDSEIPPGKVPAPACKATVQLRFAVAEYLKGTGPDELVVEVPLHIVRNPLNYFDHLRGEAQDRGAAWWSRRSPLWEERKAVLFLRYDRYYGSNGNALTFTDRAWNGGRGFDDPLRYERSWLPEVDSDFTPTPPAYEATWQSPEPGGSVSLSGDGSAPRFLSASGPSRRGSTPVVISLSDLRTRMAEFEAVLEKGKDIPGYLECITSALSHEQYSRYHSTFDSSYRPKLSMPSGLPSGTPVSRFSNFRGDKIEYDRTWLEGADGDLFELVVVDDDDVAGNGYFELLTAVRPLPSGTYEIEEHYEPYTDTLCRDFMPNGSVVERYLDWAIVIEPSVNGTILEAFFDPYELDGAVGIWQDPVAAQPTALSVGSKAATVRSLWWEDGTITLELDPYVQLTGYDIDLVDLDGSVRMVLPAEDAGVNQDTGTLTWKASSEPWRSGDTLMLRIRPEGSAPPTPGPRPWIAEVLDLTAKVGARLWAGVSIHTVELEWTKSDEVEGGSIRLSQVELWDESAGEWREPFEANAGILTMGGTYTSEVLSGIAPGSYSIRVRYSQGLETNTRYLRDHFVSEWKYVTVVVPEQVAGPPLDPNACHLREDGVGACWDWRHFGQESAPPDEIFEAISAGSYHACGLREDGLAVCWGSHQYGMSRPPKGERFEAVSAGSYHTCGLREDGAAVCWGSDLVGQSSPPKSQRFEAISAGLYHTCGLRGDGVALCWGSDRFGQSSPPPGERFGAISAGGYHTCGLREDGLAVCWGSDDSGQLAVPLRARFEVIAAGGDHTCGLSEAGVAVCWGSGGDSRAFLSSLGGYVAIGTGGHHACFLLPNGEAGCLNLVDLVQSDPPTDQNYFALSSGPGYSCGLREDGAAVCWVHEERGDTEPPSRGFVSGSAGDDLVCGVRGDGSVDCWGDDESVGHMPPSGRFVRVSVGASHACGLRSDGLTECWGDDGSGQSSPPEDRFKAISAGGYHTCGLRWNGEVACWGADDLGQSSPPSEARFIDLDAGRNHTCGLRWNGEVACWGADDLGQSSPPPAERFVAISAGAGHTCGLRMDGVAVCWGSQEGEESVLPLDWRFVAISAGAGHTCGLLVGGAAVCWGTDVSGQSSPPQGERFVAMGAGEGYSCGLREDGEAVCWGEKAGAWTSTPDATYASAGAWPYQTCRLAADTAAGEALCLGWNEDGQSRRPPGVKFLALSAGANHVCGMDSYRSMECRDFNDSSLATLLTRGRFVAVSAGADHGCGLLADGTVSCQGVDRFGQSSPPWGEIFVAISAGRNHTCGLREDGLVICWGSDEYGQSSPPPGETFKAVSAGRKHTCALREDGAAVCWGSDVDGQSSPPPGETFSAISAGGRHTCGLREDGTAVCWGSDRIGQSSPPPGEKFQAISGGQDHTCGLRENGWAVCWGSYRASSVIIPFDGRFAAISAGAGYTCALREDGEGVCWGSDEDGQVGAYSEQFVSVSSGSDHTCGVRRNGDVTCWGDDEFGQASPPGGEFASVGAGSFHTCGVKVNGAVTCWGSDNQNQATPPSGQFSSVSAASNYTCGVRADRTVVCWGSDGWNETGRTDPPPGEFASVSAGSYRACGVKTDTTVVCWGEGYGSRVPWPSRDFVSVSVGTNHACGVKLDGSLICRAYRGYSELPPPPGEYESVSLGSAGWFSACGLKKDGTLACWGSDEYGQSTPPPGEFVSVSAGAHHGCGVNTDGAVVCWGSDHDGQATPP